MLDLGSGLLALQQVLQCVLVLVAELGRIEVSRLGLDDVGCEFKHVFRDLFILDVVEEVGLLAYLVGITQRQAEQALAAGFERDDVLARGEGDLAERDRAFLADRLADHCEGLLADFAVRHHVVRAVEVDLIDLFPRHELVDLDHPLALDGNRFQLLGGKLEVFALADLIALDDVGGLHLVAALGVDLAVLDAVAGILVELMEADFLALGGRRIQGDRTRYERQLQVALPVGTGRHDQLQR